MRKLIHILFFVFSIYFPAQMSSENPFMESERDKTESASRNAPNENEGPEVAYDPGNPSDPAPIDNYIPLLLMSAIGIIFYATYKKKAYH